MILPRFPACLRHHNRVTTRFLAALAIGLGALCPPAAHAGNGPHNWLVVYDPGDPHGVSIARYYQEARGFPDRNLVAYEFPKNSDHLIDHQIDATEAWTFIESLRSEITARRLDGQIHGITLVGQAPNSVRTSAINSTTSINTALAMAPGMTTQTDWELRTNDINASFRGPDDVGTAYLGNTSFRDTTGELRPATEIRSDIDYDGNRYWLSTHLGYTGLMGLRRDEVFTLIDRSVAADGTAPRGTIYWPLNIDRRSKMREAQALQTTAEWDAIGLDYEIFGQSFGGGSFTMPESKTGAPASLPVEERAVLGIVNGSFGFDIEGEGNIFLPGSIAEHVTSFGGQFGGGLKLGQTVATEWLRAGASGSSGTVTEPFTDPEKFPAARIQTHYFNGATLAEAFWQSVQQPWQLLILGDGLTQLHARIPEVSISSPVPDATLSGIVTLLATATRPGGLEPELDLAVDGRIVAIGNPSEPLAATRVAGGFQIDTTTLSEGWHELRVIGYGADAIRTQGFATVEVTVDNTAASLVLSGPATGSFGTDLSLTATPSGLTDVAEIQIRSLGRTLATLGSGGGTASIPADELSDLSTNRLFAVAVLNSGEEISSAPLLIDVSASPIPAVGEIPTLPKTIAVARLFEDVTVPGFDWDTATPTAEVPVTDRWALMVEQPDQWPYLGDTVGNSGGVEFITRFFATETGFYDFGLGGTAPHDLLIDGQLLLGQLLGSTQRPSAFLEMGWHELRLRSRMGFANANLNVLEPFYRDRETRRFHPQGHSLQNHAAFDLRRTAAPALPVTVPQLSARTTAPGSAQLNWTDPFPAESGWAVERYIGNPGVFLVAYHGSNTPPILVDRLSPDALRPLAQVAVDVAVDDDRWTFVPPFLQAGSRLITARADRDDDGDNTLYEVSVPAGVTVYAIQSASNANPNPDWMAAQGDWAKVWAPDDNSRGFTIESERTNRWVIKSKTITTATTLQLGGGLAGNVKTADGQGDAITFVFVKNGPAWETLASLPADSTTATVSGLAARTERLRVTAAMPPVATIPSNELPLDLSAAQTNGKPAVDAGSDLQVAGTGSAVPLNGQALDDGLPASPGTLTTTWSQLTGPGTATFGNASDLATTVSFSAPGVYELQLEADDGALNATDSLIVTVTGDATANAAPTVNAGPDAALNEAQSLSLTGSVTDDGLPSPPGIVRAEWRKVSGPGGVTFLDAFDPDTTAVFSLPGTYVLELSANDGAKSATDTLTATVAPDPNQTPTVDVGSDRDVFSTETLLLNPTVSDDGLPDPPGILTFQWRQLSGPGTATFTPSDNATTEISFDQLGVYTLELRASDGARAATDTLVVSVTLDSAGNTPPEIGLPANVFSIFADTVFADAIVTDDGLPDPPAALELTWEKLSGPGIGHAFQVEGEERAALAFEQPGDYQMRLTADDGSESVKATVNVNVSDSATHRILWAWGKNFSGQAGPFDSGLVTTGLLGMSRPFPVGRQMVDVAVYSPAAAILTAKGQLLLSGSNSSSTQFLGDPNADDRSWFAPVAGLADDIVDVAHADESIAVLHADGIVSAWGKSNSGSLGGSTNIETRDTPGLVTNSDGSPFNNVAAIFGRFRAFFALRNDGTLWWWGDASSGRHGLGTLPSTSHPAEITGATSVRTVAPGQIFTLILKNDGTVESTGYNFRGQLGKGDDGSGTERTTFGPVLIATSPDVPLTNIKAIAAGDEFSLALDENGQVWAWGRNADGQLGQGDNTQRNLATRVLDPADPSGFLSDIVAIAAGEETAYAVKDDGTVMAWGNGAANALGEPTVSRSLPAPIPGLPPVSQIWAGELTAFATSAWASYEGFVSEHFTAQEIADGKAEPGFIDPATGLANLALYGLNRTSGERTGEPPVSLRIEGGQLVVQYEILSTADDLEILLESSTDLAQWDPAAPDEATSEDRGDTERATLRFNLDPDVDGLFLRLQFQIRN